MSELIFQPTTTLERNEADFLFTEVDDETVLMNVNTSAYFGLNEVATDIWQLLEDKTNFGTIISHLINKYEVAKEECEADVKVVLKQMVNNKVLHLADS